MGAAARFLLAVGRERRREHLEISPKGRRDPAFTEDLARRDRFLLSIPRMTALTSALFSLASILGIWFAASVASVPILVLCVRSQARANARLASEQRRRDWSAGSRR